VVHHQRGEIVVPAVRRAAGDDRRGDQAWVRRARRSLGPRTVRAASYGAGVVYDERAVAPGIEVWHNTGVTGAQRILPDGCLDLIFDGERLLVAGPDTTARVHTNDRLVPMHGVRLHAGRGPGLLGVPADELHDRTLPLHEVWGDRRARELTERVAAAPRRALAAWARSGVPDRFGASVRTLLDRGLSVADVAGATGYSARQLHRRTLPVFGYGPQHLARVLRLA